MIVYKAATVDELFFQKINEEEKDGFHLIQREFSPSEEETLKNIFLKPFVQSTETYEFAHPIDLDLNVLYRLSQKIYQEKIAVKH